MGLQFGGLKNASGPKVQGMLEHLSPFIAVAALRRRAAPARWAGFVGFAGRTAACLLAAGLGIGQAQAQAQAANPALAVHPPQQQMQDLSDLSQTWVESALSSQAGQQTVPLRMEVVLGRLDPRLNLAPCQQVEPYLPSGSKLWGRTRIGLRCVQGARPWNVFLPVTVRAWGPGWVLTTNLNSGDTLKPEHALQSEVDWAESPHAILADSQDWLGQTAARNLTAGMALRQTMVRATQQFKGGAQVKVLIEGGGFVVTGSGTALEGAPVGQTVRVRMDNGRTVVGTVNEAGDVVVSQ